MTKPELSCSIHDDELFSNSVRFVLEPKLAVAACGTRFSRGKAQRRTTENVKLSIVILTFNSGKSITETLEVN